MLMTLRMPSKTDKPRYAEDEGLKQMPWKKQDGRRPRC